MVENEEDDIFENDDLLDDDADLLDGLDDDLDGDLDGDLDAEIEGDFGGRAAARRKSKMGGRAAARHKSKSSKRSGGRGGRGRAKARVQHHRGSSALLEEDQDLFGDDEDLFGEDDFGLIGDDDDEDNFAADMEMEEAEMLGIYGLLPIVATQAVSTDSYGVVALLAGRLRRKYTRVAARLARLARRGKVDGGGLRGGRWGRNVARLEKVWAKLERRGKTSGMESPQKVIAKLTGEPGATAPPPAVLRAKAIQASGRLGLPAQQMNQPQRAQVMQRRRARRMQIRQQASGQSDWQSQPLHPQRGIRAHQRAQMHSDAKGTNFARRQGGRGGPGGGRGPGGGGRGRGGGGGRGRGGRNVLVPAFGAAPGYSVSPNFGTIVTEHPLKSALAVGAIFAAGVMLSDRARSVISRY